ncbi:Maternal embryonic leucine zipper kinase [Folsomia candida]|uniref:Maternal embryonic leucine zipper kinase n=2 Tax=Folsomia candida TaxID=158441 RepID=A0A226EFI1_FOLCA|nr:Maternal embryonic leucine zipper kinase [Folsomia candida]
MVSPSGYSSLFLVEMDNTQSSQTPGRPQRKGKLAWITNVAIRFYRFLRPRKIHQNSRTTLPPPPIQNSNLNNNEPSLLVRSSSMPSSCDTSLYTIASTIPLTTNTSQSESLSKNMANTVELAKTKDEREDRRRFYAWYKLVQSLNEGTFSRVYVAYHKFSGEIVAVKKIEKDLIKNELSRTMLEIEALKMLDHPNIIKLYQVFDSGRYLLLVLEICRGDLFDVIHKYKRIKERLAKKIFYQIATAVDYMHCKGFAHRDLKPENVLFDQNGSVKLIDFNLSARIRYASGTGGWNKLQTHCGTIEYAAPELVKPEEFYDGPPVDSWSLGVLLYTMLTGKFPFEEPDRKAKILSAVYHTPSYISKSARDLMKHLMQVNPKLRLSPAQILNHVWLTNKRDGKHGIITGRPESVRYYPKNNTSPLDREIVEYLASEINLPLDEFTKRVVGKEYDTFEMGAYAIFKRKKEILGKIDFERWKATWKSKKASVVAKNSKNNNLSYFHKPPV